MLICEGNPLELTPKVYRTLLVLVSHAGHLLTKDDLIENVWPDAVVEESGLARNVCLLRKILGDTSHPARYIETIPKVGYRFVAPVREIQETASSSPYQPAIQRDLGVVQKHKKLRRSMEAAWMFFAAVLGVLAILLALALLLLSTRIH